LPGSDPLEPLAAALTATVRWFQARRIPAVIIGGVAVSLHLEPRATRDVDTVIWVEDEQWPEILESAREFELEPFFDDPLGVARRSRLLVLRHRPSGTKVDIACACMPHELRIIQSAVRKEYRGLSVPIPRLEDLLLMKAVASRDKDLADMAQLAGMLSKQDLARVRRRVRQFAAVLDAPDLSQRLNQIIALKKREESGLGRGNGRRKKARPH
jgi:predicted nucleotidyltransferase